MSVDTMRNIDFYVGIPLCVVASVYLWTQRVLRVLFGLIGLCKPVVFSRSSSGSKVLFIELSEMGSAILADPALRWTRDTGKAEVYFAIFKRNVGSLKLLKTVPTENLFLIREDNLLLFAWDSLRFLFWTRKKGIDVIVDLELFSRYTSLLTAFSGATKRVGFHAYFNEGLYRGEVLTHKVAYNPHLHISKNFMALVRSISADPAELPLLKEAILDSEIRATKTDISEEALKRVRLALSKHDPEYDKTAWVLFNCAGGEFLPQRRWPVQFYAELAKLVLKDFPKAKILLTGSPAEKNEIDPVRVLAADPRVINFAGQVAFDDLPALYSVSKLLLTNDSGPAHFASCTDIPIFVFFGPETSKLYGSLGNFTAIEAQFACSPCVTAFNHRKTPCQNNRCLQVIAPESVYVRIQPCLG